MADEAPTRTSTDSARLQDAPPDVPYSGLGEDARAERLLNSAVETTRPHAERRADMVETLALLGGAFRQAGRLDDASRVQGEALALALAMGDERRDLVASVQQGLAETRREQGQVKEAESLATDAVKLAITVRGRSASRCWALPLH